MHSSRQPKVAVVTYHQSGEEGGDMYEDTRTDTTDVQ